MKTNFLATLSKFAVLLLVVGTAVGLVSISPSQASVDASVQAQGGAEVYDYVILMDKSGSMTMDQDLATPMKEGVISFVETRIEDGYNLAIIPFADEPDEFSEGTNYWEPYKSADDFGAVEEMVDDIWIGGGTAFWQAFCQGLDKLDELNESDSKIHRQVILSFSDGEDDRPNGHIYRDECIPRFKAACDEGRIIWNAEFIQFKAPPELQELRDGEYGKCFKYTDIETTPTPTPEGITTPLPPAEPVSITPSTLDLGNLYFTGKSKRCMTFWPVDDDLEGRVISFGEEIFIGEHLPEGQTMQVCGIEDECIDSFQITRGEACLDFKIVNFESPPPAEDHGVYEFFLPVSPADARDNINLFPEKIKVRFEITPEVPPVDLSISCGEFGNLSEEMRALPADEVLKQKITCELDWGVNPANLSPQVRVVWGGGLNNPSELVAGENYWFEQNGIEKDFLILTYQDESFDVVLNLPKVIWEDVNAGICGVESGQFTLRVDYPEEGIEDTNIIQAPSAVKFNIEPKITCICTFKEWIIPIIAAFVLIIVLIIITRPRFPGLAVLTVNKSTEIGLGKPSKQSWWSGTVKLGKVKRTLNNLTEKSVIGMEITPSWHGSWLGRRLNQERKAKFKFSVLKGGTLKKGSKAIPPGKKVEVHRKEEVILIATKGGDFKFVITLNPKTIRGFGNRKKKDYSGFGSDEKKTDYSGFGNKK